MSEWWVGRQGSNPVGPVTTDTLIRGIQEKKVPEDALVCRVGEQAWQRVAQVDELWEQIHPEQFLTSVTKQPWFDEKVSSGPPPAPVPSDFDGEDDSTRIYSVPILPMRTIDTGASSATPTVRLATPTYSRPQPPTSPDIPILSSLDLIPITASATNAENASQSQTSSASGVSPNQGHTSAPRAVIAPPRFGIDRVAPADKITPSLAPQTAAPSRIQPATPKSSTALGPALPSAPQAPAAVPVRPPIPAAQQFSPPQLPTGQTEALPVPRQVGLPTATVPLAPVQPAPAMPSVKEVLQSTPALHVLAKVPAVATEDAVNVITHTAAALPVPTTLEVEPTDLFDEDYESPPSKPPLNIPLNDRHPVVRESISPRPAAGTPAPPSVIVSHPPPSIHNGQLAHDVSQTPEETRPVVRSLLPPGTIQVSIGTLIIGALGLVVLVLLGVLLVR